MKVTRPLTRYGTKKIVEKIARSIPWAGAVIVVVTVRAAIRRKGFVGGLVHSGLDAIPFVGAAKNVLEFGRGRDFIPDRQRADARVHPDTTAGVLHRGSDNFVMTDRR